MPKPILRFISMTTPLLFVLALPAQDTREVVEPRIPPACVTLDAAIAAPKSFIAERNEQTLDTERIQKAMDTCAKGRARDQKTTESDNSREDEKAGEDQCCNSEEPYNGRHSVNSFLPRLELERNRGTELLSGLFRI